MTGMIPSERLFDSSHLTFHFELASHVRPTPANRGALLPGNRHGTMCLVLKDAQEEVQTGEQGELEEAPHQSCFVTGMFPTGTPNHRGTTSTGFLLSAADVVSFLIQCIYHRL